ncbi:hypothetical protein FCS83_07300 [Oenococcus sp. UCMA 17063]|nr:hypothetical protein [Oenococcus sp. UCMA 17063]
MIYDRYIWRTDSLGYVNNELGLPRLPYRTILNEIIDTLKDSIDDNLVSVFLRGSAAFDNIRPGISDLDLILVVKQRDEKTVNLIKILCERFSAQYKQSFGEISMACFEKSYFIGDKFSFFLSL